VTRAQAMMIRNMVNERGLRWHEVVGWVGMEPPWPTQTVTVLFKRLKPMPKYSEAENDLRRRMERRGDGAGPVVAADVIVALARGAGP